MSSCPDIDWLVERIGSLPPEKFQDAWDGLGRAIRAASLQERELVIEGSRAIGAPADRDIEYQRGYQAGYHMADRRRRSAVRP